MLVIWDSFTNSIHSRHRTFTGAAKAMAKHKRAIAKHNGANSYLPFRLMRWDKATESVVSLTWSEECKFDEIYTCSR